MNNIAVLAGDSNEFRYYTDRKIKDLSNKTSRIVITPYIVEIGNETYYYISRPEQILGRYWNRVEAYGTYYLNPNITEILQELDIRTIKQQELF